MDKKEEKNKKLQKQWWIVTVEGEAPIVAQFKVHAESEDIAFDIVHRSPNLAQLMGPPKFDMFRIKKRRVTIKNTFGTLINWVRNF